MERQISNRIRNLGFGWRNDVEQTSHGLQVKSVTAPDVQGSLRTVEAEVAKAGLLNRGNDWGGAYFVGGKLITGVADMFSTCDCDPLDPNCTHSLRPGWAHPTQDNLIQALRRGETITVRLAD